MIRKLLVFTVTFFGFVFLSGCTVNVPLNYKPEPQLSAAAKNFVSSPSLSIGDIQDTRGISPNLIFTTENTMSTGTYLMPYMTSQPIASIIHNALISGLETANYHILGANSRLMLSGDILNIYTGGRLTGISDILLNRMQISLTMNMRLIDSKTGKVIWYEQISGTGIANKGFGGKWVRIGFNQALNNLITNLIASPSFQAAMRNSESLK